MCYADIRLLYTSDMQTAAQDMLTTDGLNELVAEQDQSKGDSLSEPAADSETALVV